MFIERKSKTVYLYMMHFYELSEMKHKLPFLKQGNLKLLHFVSHFYNILYNNISIMLKCKKKKKK